MRLRNHAPIVAVVATGLMLGWAFGGNGDPAAPPIENGPIPDDARPSAPAASWWAQLPSASPHERGAAPAMDRGFEQRARTVLRAAAVQAELDLAAGASVAATPVAATSSQLTPQGPAAPPSNAGWGVQAGIPPSRPAAPAPL